MWEKEQCGKRMEPGDGEGCGRAPGTGCPGSCSGRREGRVSEASVAEAVENKWDTRAALSYRGA